MRATRSGSDFSTSAATSPATSASPAPTVTGTCRIGGRPSSAWRSLTNSAPSAPREITTSPMPRSHSACAASAICLMSEKLLPALSSSSSWFGLIAQGIASALPPSTSRSGLPLVSRITRVPWRLSEAMISP